MDPVAQLVEATCVKYGVVMHDHLEGGVTRTFHAPITLQPLPLAANAMHHLEELMPVWNRTIDNIARDTQWLIDTLTGSDPEFTGRLLSIFERVYHSRPQTEWEQRVMLGIFRSDYLISDHQKMQAVAADGKIVVTDVVEVTAEGHPFRQVEINTISCAFPALSTRTGLVHRDAIDTLLGEHLNIYVSESEQKIVASLAAAAKYWAETHDGAASVVVFLVQEGERNAGDQMLLAQGLASLGVPSVRRSLAQLADMKIGTDHTATILGDDGAVANVSVFYLRSLYDVKDFVDPLAWTTRESLERCSAIKCPSLPYHLCTWKRVQQALCNYPVLRRFTANDDEARLLHQCMVPQYLIHSEDEATTRAVEDAIQHPEKYVMKSQKEGTGSLIVGDQLREMLSTPKDHADYDRIRHTHLLMQRIVARRRPGRVMRRGETYHIPDLECEIGIFGTILSDGVSPVLNCAAGYLVRTKSGSSEGGGVMSGIASLDSIALTQ